MIDFNMDVGIRSETQGPSSGRTGVGPDPLVDVLRVVRLDGASFYAVEARGRWSLETPAAPRLAPRVLLWATWALTAPLYAPAILVAIGLLDRPLSTLPLL